MRKPTIVMRIIAVLVGATGLTHGLQAVLGGRPGRDPRLLVAEHAIVCVTGLMAAYALWRGLRSAPWILAVNGLAIATLVLSLGPLLRMDPVARNGLWTGAATIAVLTAIAVWYVQRRVGAATSKA